MALDRALEPDFEADRLTSMSRKDIDLSSLEERLGYRFTDKSLLVRALNHMSAVPGHRTRLDSYQRLEFLGDRVLGLCVADMLSAAYREAEEGELSRRLADLVRRESCAEVAVNWDVGPHLRLGAGEAHSGARRNQAILADVCESIVGAVFIDGGFDAASALVRRAFTERMLAPRRPLRDAKTMLQEWAQGKGAPAPSYQIVERTGPDHAPDFLVAVAVEGLAPAVGRGKSRRDAEQTAAKAMLSREGVWSIPDHE